MIEEGELPIRGFHWGNKAWYAKGAGIILPEVNFGLYYRHDGTIGEMGMRWYDLGKCLTPRLEVFDDAWKVLQGFEDLLKELAEWSGKNISDEQFVEVLKKCGFEDLTAYESEDAGAAKKTEG